MNDLMNDVNLTYNDISLNRLAVLKNQNHKLSV